jgi:hypothetical protein
MRKVKLLIGSALLALALPAYAEPTSAPPPSTTAEQSAEEPVSPHPRFQVALSYLPMAYGKITSKFAGMVNTGNSSFASGVGLAASAEVYRGLMVGIAPQVIWKGGIKAEPNGAPSKAGPDTQYELLLRLAYAYAIPQVATFYAEVMPGYSIIYPSVQDTSKGLVMVYGIGAELDLSKRIFANVGVGYQMGYQTESSTSYYRNNYVRVALGVGVRL